MTATLNAEIQGCFLTKTSLVGTLQVIVSLQSTIVNASGMDQFGALWNTNGSYDGVTMAIVEAQETGPPTSPCLTSHSEGLAKAVWSTPSGTYTPPNQPSLPLTALELTGDIITDRSQVNVITLSNIQLRAKVNEDWIILSSGGDGAGVLRVLFAEPAGAVCAQGVEFMVATSGDFTVTDLT